MKNFALGFLAINLGVLALASGYVALLLHGGWVMAAVAAGSGLVARGCWASMDPRDHLEHPWR